MINKVSESIDEHMRKKSERFHDDLKKIIESVDELRWFKLAQKDLLTAGRLGAVLAILEPIEEYESELHKGA